MHKYTELLTFLTKIRISEYISLWSEILILVSNVNNSVYLCILKYVSGPCALNIYPVLDLHIYNSFGAKTFAQDCRRTFQQEDVKKYRKQVKVDKLVSLYT